MWRSWAAGARATGRTVSVRGQQARRGRPQSSDKLAWGGKARGTEGPGRSLGGVRRRAGPCVTRRGRGRRGWSARCTHSRRSRLAPGPAVATPGAASATSPQLLASCVGSPGTRASDAPQLPLEPSGRPGLLARPDPAREDGGPRATGAESPAGRAGGALRRHGRGHEERECLLPSPASPQPLRRRRPSRGRPRESRLSRLQGWPLLVHLAGRGGSP